MSMTTTIKAPATAAQSAGLTQTAAIILARAWNAFELWHARASERRVLAELPPERLKDIGVTAAQAAAEARKPCWRA